MKEHLDESYREVLRKYQKYVIEDTCWFSIELEWHRKPKYTNTEKSIFEETFGGIPEQVCKLYANGKIKKESEYF